MNKYLVVPLELFARELRKQPSFSSRGEYFVMINYDNIFIDRFDRYKDMTILYDGHEHLYSNGSLTDSSVTEEVL